MVYSSGCGQSAAELSHITRICLAAMATRRHQLGEKGDLVDMEFNWRDAHYRRTIFDMHVPQFE